MPGAPIEKKELFSRLAGGRAAGISVVTPNRRLAQELAREFDAFQIAQGLAVWEDADILPFGAFTERLYEDALYSEIAPAPPPLLTPEQEQEVWSAAIGESRWSSELLAQAQTAQDCAGAWRLAHAWRIEGALGVFPGNEDAEAFAQWSKAYLARTPGDIDAARLPDALVRLLGERALRKPKVLVAYAFDILPPQTEDFFRACGAAGVELRSCAPARRNSNPVCIPCASAREELEAAAKWARVRLEAGGKRIGVVVPDLGRRRKEVTRVFSRVMRPGCNLPGAKSQPMPFNVSIGAPLGDYPLVHAALCILGSSAGEIPFETLSALLRSPFVGEAESEMAQRARLDAKLRGELPARVTLRMLVARAAPCPALRARLEALLNHASTHLSATRSAHEWAQHFTGFLDGAGFPGERALDSDEFQTRARFNETLAAFARLGRVAKQMTFPDALARLKRLCAAALFQPESADAPVQVLGVLESAGLEFDHLWVSGLTDDAWPLQARPHPFLPVALQKKAGIPQASAEGSLALDRRITEGWMAAAGEVVFSHPLRAEDRELLPSPLIFAVPPISAVPGGTAESRENQNYRDVIFKERGVETIPDGKAPAIADKRVRGGTRVLADHAACPFRAFARHRLGAEALDAAAEGPDAMLRGQLLHTLMAKLWGEIGGSRSLHEDLAPAIERAAAAAVSDARLEGRFAALERERLARLAREWLQVERRRGEFEVVAIEQKVALQIGGVSLSGRIDRMDRLADGSHLLVDYKTGRQLSPRLWMGPRPDEPQLPLYAVAAQEDISAVAFAKLRHGEMRYMGFARAGGELPGLKRYQDWNSLLAGWRAELDSLARSFAAGDARVDPKRGLQTCRNCDLHPLCRVHERLSPLSLDPFHE